MPWLAIHSGVGRCVEMAQPLCSRKLKVSGGTLTETAEIGSPDWFLLYLLMIGRNGELITFQNHVSNRLFSRVGKRKMDAFAAQPLSKFGGLSTEL